MSRGRWAAAGWRQSPQSCLAANFLQALTRLISYKAKKSERTDFEELKAQAEVGKRATTRCIPEGIAAVYWARVVHDSDGKRSRRGRRGYQPGPTSDILYMRHALKEDHSRAAPRPKCRRHLCL